MTDSPSVAQRSVKGFGWRPDIPDYRDHRLPKLALPSLPSKAALPADLLPPIRDQGSQGSCTGFATRTVIQYLRAKEGQRHSELSPRFVYWNGRWFEDSTSLDSGCYIRDVIKGTAKFGTASEHDCRYNPENWTRAPNKTAFKDALRDISIEYARPNDQNESIAVDQIKSIIAGEQLPIVFGFAVFSNFWGAVENGRVGMPSGPMEGGHAVTMIGYDDDYSFDGRRGGILCANSWGTTWGCEGPTGTRGWFWLLYDYVTNSDLADDFWIVRKVS